MTLADASAACDRVQANFKVPVTCTTDYIDKVPAMVLGFRTVQEGQAWFDAVAEYASTPFCSAANRHGREARVYVTVPLRGEEHARMWSCELGKWGDWFSTSGVNAEGSSPQTIAEAVRACSNIQASHQVPVTCHTDEVNGEPSLIVGFPTAADATAYLAQVAEQVAQPFCDAANRLGRRASFFITLERSQARRFDCEQQQWGEWFELKRERTTRSSL